MSTSLQTAVSRSALPLICVLALFTSAAQAVLLLPTGAIDTSGKGPQLLSGDGTGRDVSVAVGTTATLNELRVYLDPVESDPFSIRFVLFNHANHSRIVTQLVPVNNTGRGWYSSGALIGNWVLQSGQQYHIGAMMIGVDGYIYTDTSIQSANGLTSHLSYTRVTQNSVTDHFTGRDATIELYGTAVPEPTTIALSIFAGIFGVGALVRHLRLRRA